MLFQIIIGTICDSPQLAPAKWEQELNIRCTLAVEAKLFRRMVTCTHLIILDAKILQPVNTEFSPVTEPFHICTRLAEELQLHLLKLSCTECEVTRCDLVTEGLSNLTDTKRNLLTGCTLYILEVYEDTLCGLRS